MLILSETLVDEADTSGDEEDDGDGDGDVPGQKQRT